jgi:hypothetical protein
MEVIAKFSDGTIGMIRGFTITLVPENMELAGIRQSLKNAIESQLPSVIGRKLYAVGFSDLYKPTVTLENLTGLKKTLAKLSSADIPLLEPLTITNAKYLSEINAILLKLTLPNGSEAIGYTPSGYLHPEETPTDFLSLIAGSLLTSVPDKLTAAEVKAIKEKALFRGMTAAALDYAIGLKDSENDWGRGGKQRIYFHGKLLVYIDSSGKVQDWQSFDR